MLSILGLVAVAAVDAGSPLITDWAQPPTYTLNAHVSCEQADAGIFVTVFREPAWLKWGGDCDLSPLTCPTAEGRDEVLSRVAAGTLRFAEPATTVQPDAEGWVTLPVHEHDAVRVVCGELAEVFRAQPFTVRSVSLQAKPPRAEALPPDLAQLVLVNPFLREVRRVKPAEFEKLPARLREGAWIAARRRSGAWSAPVLPGEPIGAFPPAQPKSLPISQGTDWGARGGTPTTIVVDAPAMDPADMTVIVENPETRRALSVKNTHANGARFLIPRGEWDISVSMTGALTAAKRVKVSGAPKELRFILSPGFSGTVVDEAGKPVEGACVSVTEGGYGYCRAWSDREGRFALRDGNIGWARAEHARFGSTGKVPIEPGQPITLTFHASNKLIVRVPPINGKPARGWMAIDPTREGTRAEPTGSPFVGDTTFDNLTPGPHVLFIGAPGYVAQRIKVEITKSGRTTVQVPPWLPAPASRPPTD